MLSCLLFLDTFRTREFRKCLETGKRRNSLNTAGGWGVGWGNWILKGKRQIHLWSKNVMSPTGGTEWPFRWLDFSLVNCLMIIILTCLISLHKGIVPLFSIVVTVIGTPPPLINKMTAEPSCVCSLWMEIGVHSGSGGGPRGRPWGAHHRHHRQPCHPLYNLLYKGDDQPPQCFSWPLPPLQCQGGYKIFFLKDENNNSKQILTGGVGETCFVPAGVHVRRPTACSRPNVRRSWRNSHHWWADILI